MRLTFLHLSKERLLLLTFTSGIACLLLLVPTTPRLLMSSGSSLNLMFLTSESRGAPLMCIFRSQADRYWCSHGEVCLHWVSYRFQRLEVLESYHSTSCHLCIEARTAAGSDKAQKQHSEELKAVDTVEFIL
jgi:hypothetical protein